jgi:hypothetical protein
MRALVAGLVVALLVTPALAQGRQRGAGKAEQGEQAAQQKRKAEEADKAYRAGLDRIPNANTKQDPWADVRGGDGAKGTSKSK